MKLGVNLDHVATLRQARYARHAHAHQIEPSLLHAAEETYLAGAHSITLHLREDRRHIQDADVAEIKAWAKLPLNLEMSLAPTIVDIACALQPAYTCIVPEKREEVTTEGGLNVIDQADRLRDAIPRLKKAGIKVSIFIDPVCEQIELAARLNADMIELHTGCFANTQGAEREQEIQKLQVAARLGNMLGLQVHAGHGLTMANLRDLFAVPHLRELNVGHHLIARALTVGLRRAVSEMKDLMSEYQNA